jgi:hypothetical protein
MTVSSILLRVPRRRSKHAHLETTLRLRKHPFRRLKIAGRIHGTASEPRLAAAVGAALLRFILASFWIAHWWFKVGFRGMPATEAFFKQQGLPASLAWFVISFEVVIAAGLILGVACRYFVWPVCPSFLRPCGSIARTDSISWAAASNSRSCGPSRKSSRSSSAPAHFGSHSRDGCGFRPYSGPCSGVEPLQGRYCTRFRLRKDCGSAANRR